MTLLLVTRCVLLGGLALADDKASESAEPMAIINKMVEATKQVQAASYEFKAQGIGLGKKYITEIEATGMISGYKYDMPERAKLDLSIKKPDSDEVWRITAGCDGEEYYLIDHQTKVAYKDMDAAVFGSAGMPISFAMLTELLKPDPYKEVLDTKTQELQPSQTAGGEECYTVRVVYGEGPREATLLISRRDYLLRGTTFIFKNDEEGKGGFTMAIENLKINPKSPDGAFQFALPKGYTLSDDFAP